MGVLNASALRTFREMQQPRVTQEALASAVGIDQAAYSRIETGRQQPRYPLIQAIAAHLGVPVSALICADCTPASRKQRRAA